MINSIKHQEFFNPALLTDDIHIIGVGAIGSHIAEQLVRLGVSRLHLYDFDTVEAANVANQMYYDYQIGQSKIESMRQSLMMINPDIELCLFDKGYTRQALNGFVFLCVDNIDLRRSIVEMHRYNPNIIAMFDFRMGLTDAQHYAADWSNTKQVDNLLGSMQFTSAEAKAATPVSVCGTTLSILPTIREITAFGVSNWINFILRKTLQGVILCDAFDYTTCTM